ncbi:MAG: GNAT family N-acetyltransferase [Alphaproteobacteria bacterium]|nr:GNAT family N-acetyltransferase [Alphaproteobacteria bacterium]
MLPSYLLNRPFLPLATDRLALRPLEEKDAEPMAILANDKRVAERLKRLPHPYTLQDAHQFIAFTQSGIQKGSSICLAIIRRSDQTFMGVIGLEEELGFWLGHAFWGQGYGKEAMKAFVQFAFFTLQQQNMRTSALVDNAPSRRIFEGLCFSQIGTKEMTSLGYRGTKPVINYALARKDYIERYHAIKRPLLWVVAATLINERGELLLAERPPGKSLAGIWELPGGKIEEEETPEQALIRELQEELHITVEEEDLNPLCFASYRYDTFHMILPVYLCRKWAGPLHGAEGQKLAWVTYDQLIHFPLPPADILPAHRLADTLKAQGIWL